jgi:type II secretory pathway pseudopilin PulG
MKFSFLERLNKISLKTQLATLTTVIFTAIIILIILYNYQSNSKAVIEHQTNATTGLLQLEAQNLDAYFSEIDRYSLLLRHNESFMHIISSRQPMTYQEQTDIHSLLRSNFDSRNIYRIPDRVFKTGLLEKQIVLYMLNLLGCRYQIVAFDSITKH